MNSNANVGTSGEVMDTLVVLEFSPTAPEKLKQWILQEIQHQGEDNALEISVLQTVNNVVHLGMPTERLLLAAELMQMKKLYKNETPREFSIAHLENFKSSDDLSQLLTRAEKQYIVLHELESIRVLNTNNIPKDAISDQPIMEFYEGETIIPRCRRDGIIINCFPLHNKAKIDELAVKWYKTFIRPPPLDEIKSYFGVKIAMYFAFLQYYTMFLILPAVLGLVGQLSDNFSHYFVPVFSVFNLVWVSLFLEMWKQKSAWLACHWGTLRTEVFEEPQHSYYGKVGLNPITNRREIQYPKSQRRLKFLLGTIPFVSVSMYIAYRVMLFYFWMEDFVVTMESDEQTLTKLFVFKYIPTVVYVLVVMVLNSIYRNLAIRLNIWENHRLQSSYDNHLIVKLVLFNFANCFMSLFYVAFYLQDLELLRYYLGTLLIIQQFVQQLQEVALPYIIYKIKKFFIKQRQQLESDLALGRVTQKTLLANARKQADIEGAKEEYSGTLDDYLEMFIQFGYVFLFSAVFPSAAFWALLNNLIEIRTDACKLCRTCRRPFAQSASSIGIWATAFKVMSMIAVITNCALVALSPSVQSYTAQYEAATTIVIFVIIEHVIILIKITISYVIPAEPKTVQIALAKVEFKLKQKWKKQRTKEAKKHLQDLSTLHLDSTYLPGSPPPYSSPSQPAATSTASLRKASKERGRRD